LVTPQLSASPLGRRGYKFMNIMNIITIKTYIILFALLLLFIFQCDAQFNYDRYKGATLSTIIDTRPELVPSDLSGITIAAANLAYRVGVIYGDSTRAIDSLSKQVINYWITTIAKVEFKDSMYQREALFYEKNISFWIPIQDQLLPFMKKELLRGEYLYLYLTVYGGTPKGIVFSINEFEKIE
jgi:hypothetical protein